MTDYLIVYSVCIIIALIIPSLKYRFDKVLLFSFVAFVLIFFSGFRYYIGWDFEIYQSLYDAVFYSSDPMMIIHLPQYRDFELGFRLFSLTATIEPWMPVLLSCAFSVGISFLIMHKSPSRTFGVFILLYLWYEYFSVFNIQRQIIAHAIILLGLYFTIKNRSKFFIVISAPFAFTLHVSSLLAFTFYFISIFATDKKIKINNFTGLGIVVISLVLIAIPLDITQFIFKFSVLFLSFFGEIGKHASLKIAYYFDYLSLYKTGFSFRYFEYIVVFLTATFNFDKISSEIDSEYGKRLFILSLNISGIHILVYALLSSLGVIQERVESYFLLMHVILCSYVILAIPATTKIRTNMQVVVLCMLFVFIKYYRLINSDSYVGADSHYQRFVPYNNIFMGLK
ncbi:hypothetical protein GL264_10470 [Aeromonas jandaei]|uniref:EpsG family protein n=1 Tax=Aeromonas jandaei TaxID=650 RepID=UPI001C5B37E2|nr:EpsG family protein [Aeromonas jandaei]MBW3761224.1 hypothetical protein [Aeromonas jandaei]